MECDLKRHLSFLGMQCRDLIQFLQNKNMINIYWSLFCSLDAVYQIAAKAVSSLDNSSRGGSFSPITHHHLMRGVIYATLYDLLINPSKCFSKGCSSLKKKRGGVYDVGFKIWNTKIVEALALSTWLLLLKFTRMISTMRLFLWSATWHYGSILYRTERMMCSSLVDHGRIEFNSAAFSD